jgi:regulator of replication initiation timing
VSERYSALEVAHHLQIAPETLYEWCGLFGALLTAKVEGGSDAETSDPEASSAEAAPSFGQADVAVLQTVQLLLEQGYDPEQIRDRLKPKRFAPSLAEEERAESHALTPAVVEADAGARLLATGQSVADLLGAIAGSQQAVLNSQSSMRDMVSVVVQDNFSLKDENRKLRERMLELERALAEYQRREETRKERMEARMRAMEGTMAALQQQMAQFVQLQRAQQKKRGRW